MSYQRRLFLDALRTRLQREGGQYRGAGPVSKEELRRHGLDTDLFNEPEDVENVLDIQGPGGGFGFMLGVSLLGGDDPLL